MNQCLQSRLIIPINEPPLAYSYVPPQKLKKKKHLRSIKIIFKLFKPGFSNDSVFTESTANYPNEPRPPTRMYRRQIKKIN